MTWLPRIHWVDLNPQEALELGQDQAGRWTWQVLVAEWFGFGISIVARGRP